MSRWIAAGFIALGVVHAPAALAALDPETLIALYGARAGDPDFRVVLQHRAALFALITIAGFAAAFAPKWRVPTAILAGWSMTTFLVYYLAAGAPDGPLRKIAIADGVGLAVLLAVAVALWRGTADSRCLATR